MGVCDRIHVVLYRREELPENARSTLERHLRNCPRCRAAALEVERFEDLYLAWEAPGLPADLATRVLAALAGDGREAGCAEFAESVHHLVSGDLEPWRDDAMELHAQRCAGCRELLEEARTARRTWLEWEAPPPPRHIDRRVAAQVRRERPAPATGVSPVSMRHWLLRDVRLPRMAAALLVVAASLSLIPLWQGLREHPAAPPSVVSMSREDVPVPSLRLVGLYGSAAGAFDVTDGFSSRYAPERGRLLRTARK